MITKILGGCCFFLGLLIVIGFPWIRGYQPDSMAKLGVFIGIILIGIGVYLMKI